MAASISVSDFIGHSAWGKKLGADQLARVRSAARAIDVQKDDYLVRAGDQAEHWVGLMDGLVVQQVTNEAGRVTVLTVGCPGTWFGEGTLMKHGRWQYDAVARRETHAVLIPYATFHWLGDTSLAFNQFIARLLNERLSHYMGLLASERLTQVDQRMARILASLFDPDLYPGRARLLRMNQSDIALLAGMSRQRANEALQKLQDEGLVEVARYGVRVMNLEALRTY